MSSSPLPCFFQITSTNLVVSGKPTNTCKKFQIGIPRRPNDSSLASFKFLQKSVPLAASIAILLLSSPANAGLMSGFPGIESVPGPQLPQIDFLNRFNEENQKKYAENDARISQSPLMKKLLEKSKLNKEKNRREIEDKYCIRGAEWGVGVCSTEGMSIEDRDKFIAMLKAKTESEQTDE